jgi:nitrate/TMAO reductase-like tetraheme cytochrome c subunit
MKIKPKMEDFLITKDCSSCHEFMPSQKSRTALMGPSEFQHPVDIGGMEKEGTCASCHQGGAELY